MTQVASSSTRDTRLSNEAVVLLIVAGLFNWATLLLFSRMAVLDFSAIYTAGKMLLAGERHRLFDLALQAQYQAQLFHRDGPLPFNHLAYEALLFKPLAALPFGTSLAIWRILCLGLLALSINHLSEIFRLTQRQVALLLVALFPVALAIIQGQDSILLLEIIAASTLLLIKKRDLEAGLVLSLGLFKAHLVLPMVGILLLRGAFSFTLGFFVGASSLTALSIAITGWAGWLQMVSLLRYAASGANDQVGGNEWSRANLRGFFEWLPLAPHTVGLLYPFSLVLVFFATFWVLRRSTEPQSFIPTCLALTLFISPHTNLHDLTLLIFPLLAIYVEVSKAPSIPRSLCIGTAYCMVLFMAIGPMAFFAMIAGLLIYASPMPEPQPT